MTSGASTGTAPGTSAPRAHWIDLLRGVAILGILPANIPLFAMAVTAAGDPAFGTGSLAASLSLPVTRFVFDYKFITLFSLLFGAGLAIQRRNADAAGARFAPRALRRLSFLWLVGCAHAILFWFGDILAWYGFFGLLLCWFAAANPRRLFIAGTTLISIPAVVMVALIPIAWTLRDHPALRDALESIIAAGGEGYVPGAALGDWPSFFASMEHWGPAFETDIARNGTWLQVAVLRWMNWLIASIFGTVYFGWRVAGLFLLGMAWVRAGWLLAPAEHLPRFGRIAVAGLAIGIPLQAAALAFPHADAAVPHLIVAGELLQYLGSLALAAGYAGSIAWLSVRRPGAWTGPLEAVGRMAFTNYLLQTVLCTSLFASWGFGLFGRLDRAQLWLVVLSVWALQLVASPLWLSRFRYGPLEWVWRTVTYARRPRFRRAAPVAEASAPGSLP